MESVRIARSILTRPAPKRGITADLLATHLDNYRRGYLMWACRLWQDIIEEDDDIVCAFGKRRDRVASLRWEIFVDEDAADGQTAEAERQKDALQAWYSGLTVRNVLNLDEVGGVGQLAGNLIEARAFGHSVHDWIWKLPRAGSRQSVTAELLHLPPWWFESRTGKLRFLVQDWDWDGIEMAPGAWVPVASRPAIMKASSILWLYKNSGIKDWLAYLEKFGIPAVIGYTSAQPESTAWDSFREALANFGADFSMIAQEGARIELTSPMAPGAKLPHESIVELCKRGQYTLWLGSDLSTLSAQSGQGQGASLQAEERHAIETRDAQFVSESCQHTIDRQVLRYWFGDDVQPLAYFRLLPTPRTDFTAELAIDGMFAAQGLPQDRAALYNRYGRPVPDQDADADDLVFTTPAATAGPGSSAGGDNDPEPSDDGARGRSSRPPSGAAANATTATEPPPTFDDLLRAAARDLKPVRDRLRRILAIEDGDVMLAKLRDFADELPRLAASLNADPASARVLEHVLAEALARGLTTKPGRPTPDTAVA